MAQIKPITAEDRGKVLNVDGIPSLVTDFEGGLAAVRRTPLAEGGGLEAVAFGRVPFITQIGVAEDGTALYRSGIRMRIGPMLPVYAPTDPDYQRIDEQLHQAGL